MPQNWYDGTDVELHVVGEAEGNDPSPARSFNLLMLLASEDGRVRTEAEFRDLFAAAGLRLTRVVATASPNSILEGVPAS